MRWLRPFPAKFAFGLWLGLLSSGFSYTGVDNFMTTAGIGPGTHGTTGVMAFSIRDRQSLLLIRAASTIDLTYHNGIPLFINFAGKAASDIGLLAGMSERWGAFTLTGAAGLGRVVVTELVPVYHFTSITATPETEYRDLKKTGLGFPFEVRAQMDVFALGVGIYLFGDINFESSFGGAALCVSLGKLF